MTGPPRPGDGETTDPAAPVDLESTVRLLDRARAGDRAALDALFARYVIRLRRWARGRLPPWARDLAETEDLVQETLLQTFKNLESFEHRGEGALQAYVRQALVNRIRDELRRVQRKPGMSALGGDEAERGPSPLEETIGAEALDRYERALQKLRPEDREAIIARVEMGCTYQELAEALGKPSADAARKAAQRALERLVEEMDRAE